MAYANLASLTKVHRANQIITDIGTLGVMNFYTGAIPASPDIAPTGILLATLPLSSVAGVASLAIQNGVVTNPGTGGTDGIYTLTITDGTGVGAGGTYTVSGGILTAITITANGSGFTAPTFSGFGTAGLVGAAAVPVMTGVLVFNAISPATSVSTGTASFVRVATSGGTGIMDLDVGTTNSYSVIMSNTFVALSSTVSISANILIEA